MNSHVLHKEACKWLCINSYFKADFMQFIIYDKLGPCLSYMMTWAGNFIARTLQMRWYRKGVVCLDLIKGGMPDSRQVKARMEIPYSC